MIFRTPMVMLLFGENVVIRFIIHVCHFGLKIILAVHFANKIGLLPALPDDSGVSPSVLQFSNKLHIGILQISFRKLDIYGFYIAYDSIWDVINDRQSHF